jgi:DNA modification methylase
VIHQGDCVEVMAGMDPESVDAIVTDPPYGLGFMGKAWDDAAALASVPPSAMYPAAGTAEARGAYPRTGKGPSAVAFDGRAFQSWCEAWGRAAYRVAKPSAYLLAFGGTRTVHRMTVALEDAGWIIRDMLVWGYASGFPKSKASLKPAWEPIVMARKPGPLRMLAIDECRIGTEQAWNYPNGPKGNTDYSTIYGSGKGLPRIDEPKEGPAGRWPANIVLTDPIFDGGIEGVVGGGETQQAWGKTSRGKTDPASGWGYKAQDVETDYGDSGTYSRFFLIPKAARSDREPVLGGDTTTELHLNGAFAVVCAKCNRQRVNVPGAACKCEEPEWVRQSQKPRANVHPTVKPTDLMRHLVRLVTPTGGVVLDPFLGSGTTGLAAEMEGFDWIGIEREAEYVAIAEARLNGTQRGLGLDIA